MQKRRVLPGFQTIYRKPGSQGARRPGTDQVVTFPDLASARAAFALGPVRYRCLVCGKPHKWNGVGEPNKRSAVCLEKLSRDYLWHGSPGPLPPRLVVTPALAFVADYWEANVGGAAARINKPFIPGEFVLALDPAANVLGELREYFAGEICGAECQVEELWKKHRLVAHWQRELLLHRPPALLVDVEKQPAQVAGFSEVAVYHVRPAVPLEGDGPLPGMVEVSYWGLLRAIGCRNRSGLQDVLAVEYGREVFSAVVGFRTPWRSGPPVYFSFAVYQEPYGRQGHVRYFRVEGDPQELFRSLLPEGA